MTTTPQWTADWPTEPGDYWFYGYMYWEFVAPNHYLVTVFKHSEGDLVFCGKGVDAIVPERMSGLWLATKRPAPPPSLPEPKRYPEE